MNDKKWQFDFTKGDWRIQGSYEEPNNIVFWFKGQIHKTITYPGYKIWNIGAHADDIIADFEDGMAKASWNGLTGAVVIMPPETPVAIAPEEVTK